MTTTNDDDIKQLPTTQLEVPATVLDERFTRKTNALRSAVTKRRTDTENYCCRTAVTAAAVATVATTAVASNRSDRKRS